jgi:hypothetical protein
MAMADNPNEEFPDLLRGTGRVSRFQPNNTFGYQQVCLPATARSYVITDIEQVRTGTTYPGNVIIPSRHHSVAGFSLNTPPPQWSPAQTNHATWNPPVQQIDMGGAHLDRMPQHSVSQTHFPMLQGPPALQLFENADAGTRGPGHSTDHVRPQTMAQEERMLVGTRYMSPNSADLNRLLLQENEAGTMDMQAQNSHLNFDFQHHTNQATASAVSWPLIQQQHDARIERIVSDISIYDQSTHAVTRQEETSRDVTMEGNPALDAMHGALDGRSHVRGMVSAHSDPGLSSDQMQVPVSITSAPPVCSQCDYKYRNKAAFMYVR